MSTLGSGADGNERGRSHSRGGVVIRVKVKGDFTRRPRRPGIPRFWPKDVPFPGKKEPPKEEPPPQADQA